MKEITLTQGKVTVVDDEDYDRLMRYKWHTYRQRETYYVGRGVWINSRVVRMRMHRFIMGVIPQGMQVDHIDGDGLNNQKANLRIVTNRQNGQNRHVKKTSKYPGVSRFKKKQWQTQIMVNGERIRLGIFKEESDAFTAYKKAVESIGESVIGR
jgi:hypothetical protein